MRMSSWSFAWTIRVYLFVTALSGILFATGCGTVSSMGTVPISVAITNKITTIAAGAAAVTLNAQVQNDSTNAGVTWSLMANGVVCANACGTLTGASTTSVTYTPPSSVPVTPNNAPTITATSLKDGTKSDTDAFTITASPTVSVTITNKFATIVVGSAAVTLTAQLQNDSTNSGVIWSLKAGTQSCSLTCGSLSGATPTSVTYTPPATVPSSPGNIPTITATSVKDGTKFDADSFTITTSQLTVTIINKVNSITAGSAPITLAAVVTNDPTNSGVLWELNCGSAVCGTLSAQTPFSVVYTPPPTPPSAPANSAPIAAVSFHDRTVSDFDTIAIITETVSSCAGTPTGHESLLSGQYAFFAQGTAVMAGSFAAHGNGTFTDLGGNVVGNLDINPVSPQSITLVSSNAGTSFYTVGTDPAGVGFIGCLSLYGSDGSTRIFRFSLGQVSGGVAKVGRITEYDDQNGFGLGIPLEVSGLLLRQDPTAFASGDTSHLQTNYAFGLTGGGPNTQGAVAGALVLNPASGAITNSDFDTVANSGTSAASVQSDLQGSTGSITSVSAQTGRALFSFTPNGLWPGPITQTLAAIYIVNANEFFIVSLDQPVIANPAEILAWLYTGRAVASASAFNANSLSGNSIIHATGLTQVNSAFSSQVNLGLLDFSGGNLTGKIFGYGATTGATSITIASESYAVSSTFGRVTLTGAGWTNPPVLYLAAPTTDTESIEAFAAGTDSTGTCATGGLLEPGAAANVTMASLSGSYFFGDESTSFSALTPVVNEAGVIGINGAGVLTGTQFGSTGAPTFLTETEVSGSITIDNANGPGTGTLGPSGVAITNGTKLFFIDETAGTPASITVAEHQ